MLDQFRNLASSFIAKVFLAIFIASFALWGLLDFLKGASSSNVISFKYAKPVSTSEFLELKNAEIKKIQQTSGSTLTPKQLQALNIDEYLANQFIVSRMLDELLKLYQLQFSESIIFAQIEEVPAFHNEHGKFDKQKYLEFLKASNLTEKKIFGDLQAEISKKIILSVLSKGLVPTPLRASVLDFLSEKRDFSIVTINLENVQGAAFENTEDEIKNYYKENIERYSLPETRSIAYIQINPEKLKSKVSVTNADIAQVYEENINQFTSNETYTYYDLEFADFNNAKSIEEELSNAKASDKDNVIKKAIAAQANALNESINTKSLDEVTLRHLKSLKKSSVSKVYEKDGKYHVIVLKDHKLKFIKPLNEVRELLSKHIFETKLQQEILNLSKSLEDAISKELDLSKAARKLNLEVALTKNISDKTISSKAELNNPSIKEFVFSGNLNEISEPIEGANGKIYFIQITEINPKSSIEYSKVAQEISRDLKRDKKKKFAISKLLELQKSEKLEDIYKVLNRDALQVLNVTSASRMDYSENKLKNYNPNILQSIFATKVHNFTEIIQLDNNILQVAFINKITKAQASAEGKKKIDATVSSGFSNNIIDEILMYEKIINKTTVNQNSSVFSN